MVLGGIEYGIWTYLGSYFAEASLSTLFLMSGYLFFFGNDDIETIIRKLFRRVRRLLIPFFFWGAIFCALYLFVGKYSPRASERLGSAGIQTVSGFCRIVFSLTGPILYGPLWFLRALFWLSMAGVAIRLLLVKCHNTYLKASIYLAIVVLAIGVLPFLSMRLVVPAYGIALYFLGGWFATIGLNPVDYFHRGRWWWLALLLIATGFLFVFSLLHISVWACLEQVVWWVSAFAFFGWARGLSVFATNAWCRKWLLPTGFFVYIIHMFVNRIIFHAVAGHLPAIPGALSVITLVALGVSIVVPMLIWHSMSRACPRLTAILDGK